MQPGSPSSPTRPPIPDTRYDPAKYKKKSRVGDYVVYGLLLAVLLGGIGGYAYYRTRTPDEQKALLARLDRIRASIPFLAPDKNTRDPGLAERQGPKMESGILGEEAAPASPPPPAAPPPRAAPPVKSTAYSGTSAGLRPSKNPQAPAPGAEFSRYAASLKLSTVMAGPPVKIMLDGKVRAVGDTIDPDLGVVIAAIDLQEKYLTLRDRTRAELLLYY